MEENTDTEDHAIKNGEEFSAGLKQSRLASGFTMRQAANAAGIDKSRLWRLENNQGVISLDNLVLLLSIYNTWLTPHWSVELRPAQS